MRPGSGDTLLALAIVFAPLSLLALGGGAGDDGGTVALAAPPPGAAAPRRRRAVWPAGVALVAREAHRDPHPAADAQRRQALFGVALLHLVDERDEDARPRGADRVAQ